MACPDEAALAQLIDGEVDGEQRGRLLDHLDECEACLAVVARAQSDGAARGYVAGDRLGRYEIAGVLGAGAMGVVYEARDLELERAVALKVVRPDRAVDDAAALGERLRGEARALARVSSPYVVAIHDVGTVGDEVFIALEKIDGPTLRGWLAERPRSLREIAAALAQAGQGLAAAHEVGVIHRDVKPDNVLVGRDGRTRVSDFGLARDGGAVADLAVPGDGSIATRMIAGTPAYMSPEQRAGKRATPASDQFAFCMTLVEAVTGARARDAGALPDGCPEPVRRIAIRGLAEDPAARWPSMRAVVAALQAIATPRVSRWWLAAALAVSAGLGLAAAMIFVEDDAARGGCDVGTRAMAATWSPARATALRGAMAGRAQADRQLDRALPRLDDWGRRWALERDGTCRADELTAARAACLDLRRQRVDAFLGLVEAGDAGAAEQLVEVTQRLPDPADCARASGAPESAETRAQAAELEGRIAVAAAEVWAGRLDEPKRELAEVVAAAEAGGLGRVRLHALVEQGRLLTLGDYADARRALQQALELALAQGDREVLTDVLILVTELASHEGDLPLTEWMATTSRGALAATGGDPGRDAQVELSLCKALERTGKDPPRALEVCERARHKLVAAYGADDLRVATAHDLLGNVAYWAGRWDDALAQYDQALALAHRVLGIVRGNSEGNRAHVLIELGRAGEAEAILLGLLARFPERGYLHDGVAIARRRQADFAGALEADHLALASCESEGARACQVWAHVGVGEDLLGLERPLEALAAFERAAAVGVEPAPIERARIELGRARVLAWRGDRARAAAGAAAALAILDGADAGTGPEAFVRAAILALEAELAR